MAREAELINRTAAGDLQAFETLCRLYQNRLFVYLFRMLRSRETAEEVLNDVILGIWKSAAKFKGESRLSTWIFGIARKKALTRYGKQRYLSSSLEEAGEFPVGGDGPEIGLIRQDMVRKALEQLSTEHREVVELTFYLGFSYQEIAAIVECPVNTVKTRMFHARKQLRLILERNGE